MPELVGHDTDGRFVPWRVAGAAVPFAELRESSPDNFTIQGRRRHRAGQSPAMTPNARAARGRSKGALISGNDDDDMQFGRGEHSVAVQIELGKIDILIRRNQRIPGYVAVAVID